MAILPDRCLHGKTHALCGECLPPESVIFDGEEQAVRAVIDYGASYGYGNLIHHLRHAWARMLVEKHGMSEADAKHAAGFPPE